MPEEAKRRKNPESFAKRETQVGKETFFFFARTLSRRNSELTSESMKTIETGPHNLATIGNICGICNDSEIYVKYITTGGF